MSAHVASADLAVFELPHIEADLHFLAPMNGRPHTYAYEPPAGVARTNAVEEARRVAVYDARGHVHAFSLDREGFSFLQHQSAVRDFADDDEVRRIYYPEVERLITAQTGAARVVIFDHTVRQRVRAAQDRAPGTPRQPATRVHVDQTAKSGPQRVRDIMGAEAETLLKGRAQIINLWRPIRGPLRDAPLAMADARSVAAADLVPSDLIYRDRVGEIYTVKYNPDQQWFYLSGMQPTEALLIKCFDSATDGRARFAPHTAFNDPTAPADILPRESIEVRTLVFHPS
jgi:hypothetical protein